MGFYCCIRCRVRWHISWRAHQCTPTALARVHNNYIRLELQRDMRHALSMAGSMEKRGLVAAAERWLAIAVTSEIRARGVPLS